MKESIPLYDVAKHPAMSDAYIFFQINDKAEERIKGKDIRERIRIIAGKKHYCSYLVTKFLKSINNVYLELKMVCGNPTENILHLLKRLKMLVRKNKNWYLKDKSPPLFYLLVIN